MSGTVTVNLAQLINAIQSNGQVLTAILAALKAGVPISPDAPVYTVAALPTTATNGQYAFASNGRKAAEGSGAGTGVPVYYNAATSQWFTYSANVLVTS